MNNPDRRGFLIDSLRYAIVGALSFLTAGLVSRGSDRANRCLGCPASNGCQWSQNATSGSTVSSEDCKLAIEKWKLKIGEGSHGR